jgi:hypothetical protein
MTKDEIIEMVMQIGGCDRPEDDSPALRMFEAFAKLVSEKAIKEALEQTEQKPVACERCKQLEEQAYDLLGKLKVANIKLSMRPQRTWVGLTDEDLKLLSAEWRIVYGAWMDDFARDIEAKLKERNT